MYISINIDLADWYFITYFGRQDRWFLFPIIPARKAVYSALLRLAYTVLLPLMEQSIRRRHQGMTEGEQVLLVANTIWLWGMLYQENENHLVKNNPWLNGLGSRILGSESMIAARFGHNNGWWIAMFQQWKHSSMPDVSMYLSLASKFETWPWHQEEQSSREQLCS